MENDVFFDYFLKSLRFHLGDTCKDITGVEIYMNVSELERLNKLFKI